MYLLGIACLNVASLKRQLHLIFETEAANGNITDMMDDDAASYGPSRVFGGARMTGSTYLYLT